MADLAGGSVKSPTPFQLYRRLALGGDGACVQTITTAVTVTPRHEEIIILNPSTGTRVVTLPTAAAGAKKGEIHLIYNNGTTWNLTVNKPAATTLATLNPGEWGIFVYTTAWTCAGTTSSSSDVLGGTNVWSGSNDFAATTFKVNTILESTGAAGVTIDGCLVKDGVAAAATTSVSVTTAAGTGATGSDGTGATGSSGTDAITGTSASTSTAVMATETFAAPAAKNVAVHVQIFDDAPTPVVTGLTNPAIPRNIRIAFGAQWAVTPGGDVTVAGTNQDDGAASEVIASNPGNTVVGADIFKTVTSITFAAGAGGGTHTIDVTTGDKLGILAAYSVAVGIAAVDGVLDLAVFSAAAGERGFTPVDVPNGAKNYAVTVPSTAVGHTHGVGSFAGPAHTHTGPAHTHTGPSHTH